MSSSERQALEQQTRQDVVLHVVQATQADIEAQLFSMSKWQAAIRKEADSSKERTKLRQKLSDGEARLKKMVDDYNKLALSLRSVQLPAADLEVVKSGHLPWQFDGAEDAQQQQHPVALKTRLEVCEKWQWLQRTMEGQEQVLKGMLNFVHYYQALQHELRA